MTMTTLGSRQVWSAALSEVSDGDLLAFGAEVLADDEGAVDAVEEQGEFGGPGAGRGEDGDLGVGAADVDGAAQGAAVGDDDLGVVPGHPGPGEGGGDGGDGGHDLDLQAVLGGAQGAYDAEEAGVAVGEDDGGAAVAGDAAGGEVDAAEPDALGVRGHFGQRQVVGGAGHEGGGAEGGPGRGGQRRAVPADHRDPVGHRRLSPGCVSQVGQGLPGTAVAPARRSLVRGCVVRGRRSRAVAVRGGQFQSVYEAKPSASASWSRDPVEVLGEQAPDDEVGAEVGPAAVLGAGARYTGVAQHALADAADLLGDLLGGGVVGGGAQLDALELLVAEQPVGDGQHGLGGVALAARPGGDDVDDLGGSDPPVGVAQMDDADQPLGEELGDGEDDAAARGAFGGGVLA